MSARLTRELVPEMAGALTQIRESVAPAVYLEELEHLLAKQQNHNRSLVASLLAALPEDFLVPLAAKVPQSDDPAVSSFASLYKKVATQVRALAPESPLGRRLHAEQQVLDGVFRDISRRTKAEKQQKVAVVESHYDGILQQRKNELRKQPEIQRIRRLSVKFTLASALLGLGGMVDHVTAEFITDIDSYFLASSARALILSIAIGILIGRCLGLILVTLAFYLIFRLFAATPEMLHHHIIPDGYWFLISMAILLIGRMYHLRYRKKIESSLLTHEESSAYHESLENIEDHFRQKEELEQARATIAAAKAQPLSRGFVLQELGLGE
jgi:hypothetical protein